MYIGISDQVTELLKNVMLFKFDMALFFIVSNAQS
jgi:hypothetical protein